MANLNLTEPDFLQIKTSLKQFLASQSVFQDYDFEGSSLSILLDILAYNSSLIAFYTNMVGSEMFLDSAALRNSAVSRAKAIGYLPVSRTSARAILSVEFFPDDSPAGILIPAGTKFTTTIDSKTYYFSTSMPYYVKAEQGVYTRDDIEVVEGTRLVHRWTVDLQDADQKFELPNAGVDTSTIQIKVQNSDTDSAQLVYTRADFITEIDDEDLVYFVKEIEDLKYEVYFGNGVVGAALENGNIVIVEYVVSSGSVPNKASTFTPTARVASYAGTVWATVQEAFGGAEEESISDIKLKAPLSYEAQHRAVIKSDYEILLRNEYPSIESIRVWGGEDNVPPEYGKVFISLKTVEGYTLSNKVKQYITDYIVARRNPISIESVIVDPEFLYLIIDSTVKFRSTVSSYGVDELQSMVVEALQEYCATNLNKFDRDLQYSKLVQAVDDVDASIDGNFTKVSIKYRLYPTLNVDTQYTIDFNNELDKGDVSNEEYSLGSSEFIYDGWTARISDDGHGSLYIYRIVAGERVVIKSSGVGTIDYVSGRVVLTKFAPESIVADVSYIDLTVSPKTFDIQALRQQILIVDNADITVDMIDLSAI